MVEKLKTIKTWKSADLLNVLYLQAGHKVRANFIDGPFDTYVISDPQSQPIKFDLKATFIKYQNRSIFIPTNVNQCVTHETGSEIEIEAIEDFALNNISFYDRATRKMISLGVWEDKTSIFSISVPKMC